MEVDDGVCKRSRIELYVAKEGFITRIPLLRRLRPDVAGPPFVCAASGLEC